MAYRKRNFRRRRGGRARYSKSKKLVTGHGPTMLERIASGVGSAAKLAAAVAPAIAAINTEHKYVDYTGTLTAYAPGTNDTLTLLTDSQTNTNDQSRIGNSILAKELLLRLAMSFTSTGSPTVPVRGVHCRWMLICWKENAQQNAPSINKIFEVPSNLYSPVSKDNSDSFVVLKDKFFSMNASTSDTASCSSNFMSQKFYKKINWHMRYNGDSNGSQTQNHIYLITRCSASSSSNALNTTYYSRLNFTDN